MQQTRSILSSSLALSLMAAALLGGGCGKTETAAPANTNTTAAGKAVKSSYTIGMSQCNLGEPWRVEMNAQIKAAADKHPELKVVFKDAQNDTLQQRAHVEEFVSAGRGFDYHQPEGGPAADGTGGAGDAGGHTGDRAGPAAAGDELHVFHRGG